MKLLIILLSIFILYFGYNYWNYNLVKENIKQKTETTNNSGRKKISGINLVRGFTL
ncbi:MAG: hypothetical protein QM490_04180 [Candidatus Gracilibacteria bacterium]